MELREYFKIIGRYKWIFWGIVIAVALFAFIFTKVQPKSYLAGLTLTVNKSSAVKQSQANYYLYDNYYNVQSSSLFSEIVTSWFGSPAVTKEVYEKAGVPLPVVSQKNLVRFFKAIRVPPATINVSIGGTDKDELTRLVVASADVMQEKTNELARTDRENVYDITKTSPIVTETTQNTLTNTLIGLIAGIFLGVIFVLALDYFNVGKVQKNS